MLRSISTGEEKWETISSVTSERDDKSYILLQTSNKKIKKSTKHTGTTVSEQKRKKKKSVNTNIHHIASIHK